MSVGEDVCFHYKNPGPHARTAQRTVFPLSSAGTGLKPTLQPPARADVGLVPAPQADERKGKRQSLPLSGAKRPSEKKRYPAGKETLWPSTPFSRCARRVSNLSFRKVFWVFNGRIHRSLSFPQLTNQRREKQWAVNAIKNHGQSVFPTKENWGLYKKSGEPRTMKEKTTTPNDTNIGKKRKCNVGFLSFVCCLSLSNVRSRW